MPFTLAHPAAVLPLARGPLVPAALVAGAMSPDVPYFVRLPRSADAWYEPFVNATTTHAWPGALTVAVPSAAVLLAVWWFVRLPLRALAGTDGRAPERTRTLRAAAWTLVSLAVGVATHVAWDAVTHGDGAAVQHIAWLREPLLGDMPAARVLQHASTVLGLVALGVWAGRRVAAWRAAGGRLPVDRVRAAVVAALVVAGLAGALVGAAGSAGAGAEAALSSAATRGGAAFVVAGLVAAAAWWALRLRPVAEPRADERTAATGAPSTPAP